jgi:anti-sigma regulatory factor (Ser/Thr protein kinase)
MPLVVTDAGCSSEEGYRHEALLYAGHDEFMGGALGFVREAIAADEPVLVVVSTQKIDALRGELGGDSEGVLFADMATVGTNPARIIPAWQTFVERHAASGRRLRGIGEPVHPARRAAELVECQRHEALLNLAFGDHRFWLLCPYDTTALADAVIDEARRSHPFVCEGGVPARSADYVGAAVFAAPFDEALPPPPPDASMLAFDVMALRALRRLVGGAAVAAGLSGERASDFVLAANEIATNSLTHGGGHGVLRVWREPSALLCEISDAGLIEDPLVGRRHPGSESIGGRGLWVANQVCELVQVRSSPSGTNVRLHMALA